MTFAFVVSAQQTSVTVSTSRDARGNGVTSTFGASGANYDPSHVLVEFAGGARDFLPGSGPVRTFPENANLFRVENPPGLSVADAVQRYKRNPNVRFAEPDFIVQAVATPTDPMWPQWDMNQIAAPAAWTTQTDASDVIVAVVDTGIDYTHEDLQGNLWTSGTSHGFTCINGSCVPGGADDFGHGTHVAGTIGAVANNGKGIAGLNWHAQILSIKFLDSNGSGLISDAVVGFQQILALKQAGYSIRVTSNSWGGGGFSQALKDAMAAVEAAGIVNVCAAGNNAQNADISPMYPGAYDNRGIISVLASDASDAGAYFTNFGLASVDIAAPGVSTLSTVPTGTCTLCDPSGYKLLSGTSMATPHVSGVMAALLHQHPGLTAFQAREVVLDPSSYDTLSDAKAKSTSTGGRLNFYKTLNSSRLPSPVLNNFPTLTMGPDATAGPGGNVSLTATASDADAGDVAGLRLAWNKSVSTGTQWLFGWMLNSVFPNPSGPSVSFAAPSLARVATVPYYAAVADNRGGGASGGNFVTVTPAANGGLPPTGTVSVSNATPAVGDTITVNFPANDPDGIAAPPWDLWIGGMGGASGTCCFTGSAASVKFNSAGVYRVGAQAIDPKLNLSPRSSAVVKVGGATGEPPLAAASLDQLSGPVPLTVNIDMSGSTDAGGTVQWYFFICNGGGFTAGSQSSKGSCTYTTPGAYWIMLEIQDNNGNVDLISAYVVATPAAGGGGDTTPPTVSIASPADKAIVTGTVAITANASDTGSGVKQVDFYVDNVFLATATAPSYTVNWNTTGLVPGSPHSLKATAIDNANNSSSASVSVTMLLPLSVTLTAPANGSPLTRKSSVNLTATTAGSYPITRVDFLVNNVVVCSDTSSPYSCAWKVPAAIGKTYQIQAKAYDSNGASASSTVATVNAK